MSSQDPNKTEGIPHLPTRTKTFQYSRVRAISFAVVALLHILVLLLVAFDVEINFTLPEPVTGVMRLVDVEERIPDPPPPPPEIPHTNTRESIAETMIEVEEVPEEIYEPVESVPVPVVEPEVIEYVSQARITVLPVFPEDELRRNTIYPPIAQRSNIEGTAYLDLFIDRFGVVRDVRILREDPPNRGFGEAAANAFRGIKVKPAEADGVAVAVRYRYNFIFTLR